MRIELEPQDIEAIAQRLLELLKPILLGNGKGEDDTILDVQSLAEYLRVNKQWVYDKIHQEAIPYYKLGKYPRFRKAEIDEWLQRKGKGNGKKPSRTVRRLLEDTS